MNGVAVRIDDVSKKYRIGVARDRQPVRQPSRFGAALRGPLDRLRPKAGSDEGPDVLWAVRDVSLDIPCGQVIGIVGRNGAGKSTLLKLLSRITRPTRGRITMHGRVSSLLEVGTGFNPELTGRENVYLNGAILGMRRTEIDRRFDEIVAFSEVEQFLDTPVKHYSSGMYVRLAFAVAAHLDTEIMIVDEVLAVGDAAFQKKCLGRIGGVAKNEGRTILFVGHHMPTIQAICSRAVLLDHGRMVMDAAPEVVTAHYLRGIEPAEPKLPTTDGTVPDSVTRIGNGDAKLRRAELRDTSDRPIQRVLFGQPFRVALEFEVFRTMAAALVEVGISTSDGLRVATVHSTDGDAEYFCLPPGRHEIIADIDVTLLPRDYVIDASITHSTWLYADWVERVAAFTALNIAESGGDHYRCPVVRGYLRPASRWSVPSLAKR